MVRKMLKAFIKVTADKTHFSIDTMILTILVYHFIFHYNPPEYNIISYATSSFLNLLHNQLYQSLYQGCKQIEAIGLHLVHHIISQYINLLINLPLLLFDKFYHSTITVYSLQYP